MEKDESSYSSDPTLVSYHSIPNLSHGGNDVSNTKSKGDSDDEFESSIPNLVDAFTTSSSNVPHDNVEGRERPKTSQALRKVAPIRPTSSYSQTAYSPSSGSDSSSPSRISPASSPSAILSSSFLSSATLKASSSSPPDTLKLSNSESLKRSPLSLDEESPSPNGSERAIKTKRITIRKEENDLNPKDKKGEQLGHGKKNKEHALPAGKRPTKLERKTPSPPVRSHTISFNIRRSPSLSTSAESSFLSSHPSRSSQSPTNIVVPRFSTPNVSPSQARSAIFPPSSPPPGLSPSSPPCPSPPPGLSPSLSSSSLASPPSPSPSGLSPVIPDLPAMAKLSRAGKKSFSKISPSKHKRGGSHDLRQPHLFREMKRAPSLVMSLSSQEKASFEIFGRLYVKAFKQFEEKVETAENEIARRAYEDSFFLLEDIFMSCLPPEAAGKIIQSDINPPCSFSGKSILAQHLRDSKLAGLFLDFDSVRKSQEIEEFPESKAHPSYDVLTPTNAAPFQLIKVAAAKREKEKEEERLTAVKEERIVTVEEVLDSFEKVMLSLNDSDCLNFLSTLDLGTLGKLVHPETGQGILHMACLWGKPLLIDRMIKGGCSVHLKGKDERLPIHFLLEAIREQKCPCHPNSFLLSLVKTLVQDVDPCYVLKREEMTEGERERERERERGRERERQEREKERERQEKERDRDREEREKENEREKEKEKQREKESASPFPGIRFKEEEKGETKSPFPGIRLREEEKVKKSKRRSGSILGLIEGKGGEGKKERKEEEKGKREGEEKGEEKEERKEEGKGKGKREGEEKGEGKEEDFYSTGDTLLHLAVRSEQSEIVTLLLPRANFRKKNKRGVTVLDEVMRVVDGEARLSLLFVVLPFVKKKLLNKIGSGLLKIGFFF